jgi:predicted aspartyl protease
LLLIPVTVNGQGPFLFVLDTGATRTMLDRGLADRLQLQSEGHRPGQGTGGIIDAT